MATIPESERGNKPEKDGYFTLIRHWDMTGIISANLSVGELKMLLLSIREAWGWQRTDFTMGYKALQENTKLSRPALAKALHTLQRYDVLIPVELGNTKHQQTTYRLNPTSKWKLTSKKGELVNDIIQNCIRKLTRTSSPYEPELVKSSVSQVPPNKIINKEIEEKSIEKKVTKVPYGTFSNVLLTPEEYKKLEDQLNSRLPALIEELSTYMESTGKKYKSHYATLLVWSRKERNGGTNHVSADKGNPRQLPARSEYTDPATLRIDFPDRPGLDVNQQEKKYPWISHKDGAQVVESLTLAELKARQAAARLGG